MITVQLMRKRLVNIALALGVSVLTLAALEGACRLWESSHPPEGETVTAYLFKWHGRVPPWGPPEQEFNADGMRDRPHAVEKPEGVRRVVFLGDSVTLGYHVQPDEAFPQRLGARFEQEGRPVEVFNVAMHGWSTRDERLAYQRIARRYRPDDVVLSVCLNDITALQNDPLPPSPWLLALHKRYALVRMAVHARAREITSVRDLFARKDSPPARAAFTRFFSEIRALRDEVQADGGTLSIIVLPFHFQVQPNAPAPSVQAEIASFAAAERIPFLDLLPALAPLGDAGFVDWDHLSPTGTRRTAEEIATRPLLHLPPSPEETLAPTTDPPSVVAALRAPDAEHRAAAAWLLGQQKERRVDVDAQLGEMVRHDASEHVRAEAARALGGRHARERTAPLLTALGDERAAVRRAAALALYDLQPLTDAALPSLVEAVANPDAYVRGFAAWSLQNMGPAAARAVPALVAVLSDDDAFTRETATLALGNIGVGRSDAVAALAQQLTSPDPARARAAARALGRMGPAAADALPALLRAATDKSDDYLRLFAVKALGKIAPKNPGVVRALKVAASSDGMGEVRELAESALRQAP
jgi:HEAT repeat protein/lysophospholipase L1-like esterase